MVDSGAMKNKLACLCASLLFAVPFLMPSLPLCVAQNELKLPADFPKDIPLYRDAKLYKAGNYMDNPKLGKQYLFDTADAVDAAIAFYKAQLPASGWTITKNSYVANPNTITIMKGNRMVMISPNRVMANGGGQVTRIDITVMALQ